jgi:hypothetical protein
MSLKITVHEAVTQTRLADVSPSTFCEVIKDGRGSEGEPTWLPGEIIWYYCQGTDSVVVHCIDTGGLSFTTIPRFDLKGIIVEELKPGDSITIEIK